MHNVNTDALKPTIDEPEQDPSSLNQHVSFDGERQTQEGRPQFRTTIPVPARQGVYWVRDPVELTTHLAA